MKEKTSLLGPTKRTSKKGVNTIDEIIIGWKEVLGKYFLKSE